MHVTENNEISSKEKSPTNLDLARDRQITEREGRVVNGKNTETKIDGGNRKMLNRKKEKKDAEREKK